jgi:hypothetical protein
MVVEGAVKAPDLVRFLRRLVRDAGRKVFLVLDRLKVHRARLTRDWLAGHRAEIEVAYLPSYSPEPSGQCPEAGRGRERRPQAGGPPQGTGPQQAATQAGGRQPHARALEAATADPRHLPAPAVPLRRLIQLHPGRLNMVRAPIGTEAGLSMQHLWTSDNRGRG